MTIDEKEFPHAAVIIKLTEQMEQEAYHRGLRASVEYSELIMAVARKFPGETRHQTALRYIREAESRSELCSEASKQL